MSKRAKYTLEYRFVDREGKHTPTFELRKHPTNSEIREQSGWRLHARYDSLWAATRMKRALNGQPRPTQYDEWPEYRLKHNWEHAFDGGCFMHYRCSQCGMSAIIDEEDYVQLALDTGCEA
jgi:hypothetical protein